MAGIWLPPLLFLCTLLFALVAGAVVLFLVRQKQKAAARSKCPICSREIPADAKICPYCGKNITE